jgi:hypothetical protein
VLGGIFMIVVAFMLMSHGLPLTLYGR